ncbi:butyrate kinase [Paradesulfitobacterium aromaticivorans]
MAYNILALNLGSTSTKIAYFEDENCLYRESLSHSVEELNIFSNVLDQYEYRLNAVRNFLESHGINEFKLDAVVSRGGHTRPIESGVYRVNGVMLTEIKSGQHGRHACDLGSQIAYELAGETGALPLVVDPPVTDEFEPLARLSGLPQIPRISRFHALNQKAIARRCARDLDRSYSDLRLIVVHMGGGISISAHKYGRMIDANNALDGDGPFAPERSGGLPARGLVDICFSGQYSREEVYKLLNGRGGLTAFLGTSDVREIERRIDEGDEQANYYLEGMSYQVAKEIGAMAAVLEGKVDAIAITGGIAHSARVVGWVKQRVEFIAPVYVYPGEDEMEALALGALRGLKQEEEIKVLIADANDSVSAAK